MGKPAGPFYGKKKASKPVNKQGEVKRQKRLPYLKKWEELRTQNCNRKPQLVAEILKEMGEDIAHNSHTPDLSRVLQSCAQHGSATQVEKMWKAIVGKFEHVCTTNYSFQVVLSMLRHQGARGKALFEPAYQAVLPLAATLVRNKFGSQVFDVVYSYQNKARQHELLVQIINRLDLTTAWQKDKNKSLEQLWEGNDELRIGTLQNMWKVVDTICSRGLFDSQVSHQLMLMFLKHGWIHEIRDMVGNSCKAIVHFCGSKLGTQVALLCLDNATKEQRTEVLSTMERSIAQMAVHPSSYLVVCRLFDVIEDAGAVQNILYQELLTEELQEVLLSNTGSKTLLHLFTPDPAVKKKYFQSHADSLWAEGKSATLDREERHINLEKKEWADTKPTCEQDIHERHDAARAAFLPALLALVIAEPEKFLTNFHARRLFLQVLDLQTNVPKASPNTKKAYKQAAKQLDKLKGFLDPDAKATFIPVKYQEKAKPDTPAPAAKAAPAEADPEAAAKKAAKKKKFAKTHGKANKGEEVQADGAKKRTLAEADGTAAPAGEPEKKKRKVDKVEAAPTPAPDAAASPAKKKKVLKKKKKDEGMAVDTPTQGVKRDAGEDAAKRPAKKRKKSASQT
eukprot:NODE_346_length_2058_cov_78.015018_g340_i0.p1 GENE.NODE_346_length_2058_cov_78.015018_g340_i0~~NODE_346_length_2058_cov_78.015018_g340_i0.p1  ORF type:complete len:622 (-),score=199.36 NODE_346_length_2058_cov_78.015018_g340_i0:127-1992(-)